jgi:N-acetylneuraminate epimerase
MPNAISSPSSPQSWRQLPSYPQNLGVAGVLAGQHGGVLIAAGGANFPDRPPWEGGTKKYYDDIHVLLPGATEWMPAGRLPEPRGYSAVVSVPGGVLVLGGENAGTVFADTLWLRWDGQQVVVSAGPVLPAATTCPAAVQLDEHVYLAAGYAAGPSRHSKRAFWRLDLQRVDAGWMTLPVWPGPSRGQSVMAALAGAVYLFSGIETCAGADGHPKVSYLTDAYRFRSEAGWETLPDLPRSAIAAPSPAPVSSTASRIFLLGGVDGRLVGKQPRDTRVPDSIIFFDLASGGWKVWPQRWPDPVVTAPAVHWGNEWIIVSGETMAAVRTPHAWAWKAE